MSAQGWLDEIEQRIARVTPGRWHAGYVHGDDDPTPRDILVEGEEDDPIAAMEGDGDEMLAIAQLFAHAPEDLYALVAEVKQLRAELAAQRRLEQCVRGLQCCEGGDARRTAEAAACLDAVHAARAAP